MKLRRRQRRRPRTYWLGRALRLRRLDGNPLRRGSDRAETVVLGVLLAIFLAGASVRRARRRELGLRLVHAGSAGATS